MNCYVTRGEGEEEEVTSGQTCPFMKTLQKTFNGVLRNLLELNFENLIFKVPKTRRQSQVQFYSEIIPEGSKLDVLGCGLIQSLKARNHVRPI